MPFEYQTIEKEMALRTDLVVARHIAPKVDAEASTSSHQSSRTQAKLNKELPPERWLVHPGRMGGDLWHIVGALLLDPNLKLLIVDDVPQSSGKKLTRNAAALIELLLKLEIEPDNVGPLSGKTRSQGRVFLARGTQNTSNDDAWAVAKDQLSKASSSVKGYTVELGMTWASTSVIVDHAYAKGVKATQDFLRHEFLRDIAAKDYLLVQALTLAPLLSYMERLASKKKSKTRKIVLVNMRNAGAGQNTQHNISEEIYDQISKVVTNSGKDYVIIRVGLPEVASNDQDLNWITKHYGKSLTLDIYHDRYRVISGGDTAYRKLMRTNDASKAIMGCSNCALENTKLVCEEHGRLYKALFENKQLQPYLWKAFMDAVEEMSFEVIGMIGGRSGGMDIASFMGLRTLSWDDGSKIAEQEFNHMRLHWAAPFNSVIERDGSALDDNALKEWIKGTDCVPLHKIEKIEMIQPCHPKDLDAKAPNTLWFRSCKSSDLQEGSDDAFKISDRQMTPGGNPKDNPYRRRCLVQVRNTCGQRAAHNLLAMMTESEDGGRQMNDVEMLQKLGGMQTDIPDEQVQSMLDKNGGTSAVIVSSLAALKIRLSGSSDGAENAGFGRIWNFADRQARTAYAIVNTLCTQHLGRDGVVAAWGHYFALKLEWCAVEVEAEEGEDEQKDEGDGEEQAEVILRRETDAPDEDETILKLTYADSIDAAQRHSGLFEKLRSLFPDA